MNELSETEKCEKCATEIIDLLTKQVKTVVRLPFISLYKIRAEQLGKSVTLKSSTIEDCLATACFTAAVCSVECDGVAEHFSKINRLCISKFLSTYPAYKGLSDSINTFMMASMHLASNSVRNNPDALDEFCELWFWRMLFCDAKSELELRNPVYRTMMEDSCRVFHKGFKECLIKYYGEPAQLPKPAGTGCLIPLVAILASICSAIAAV